MIIELLGIPTKKQKELEAAQGLKINETVFIRKDIAVKWMAEGLYEIDHWISFLSKQPAPGQKVFIRQPPEQCKLPYAVIWNKDIEIIEGADWMPIPEK